MRKITGGAIFKTDTTKIPTGIKVIEYMLDGKPVAVSMTNLGMWTATPDPKVRDKLNLSCIIKDGVRRQVLELELINCGIQFTMEELNSQVRTNM